MRREEDIDDWEMFCDSKFTDLEPEDKVTGTVISITATAIQVHLGIVCTAYIPLSESDDISDIHVGDVIDAYVVHVYKYDSAVELTLTPPYAPEPDMDELRDSLYEEILSEVRDGLSQMKPEVISSITEQAVRRLNSYYSSRIEQLEKRISKLENLIDRTGVITK